jgi:hypothetical protein
VRLAGIWHSARPRRTTTLLSALLLLALWASPTPAAQDPPCTPGLGVDCPLVLGEAAWARLEGPGAWHGWSVSIPQSEHVYLTLLPAEMSPPLRWSVFDPHGDLVETQTVTAEGEHVLLTDPEVGEYRVLIEAPSAPIPPEPYLVFAWWAAPGAGTILAQDGFDLPERGWFPEAVRESDLEARYLDGEYQIHQLEPSAAVAVSLPLYVRDATLAVDARVEGDTRRQLVNLSCRAAGRTRYVLLLDPTDGDVALRRQDADRSVTLVEFRVHPAVRRGNATNRIELSCLGRTISGRVNGVEQFSVDDDGITEPGLWAIGGGTFLTGPQVATVRFDNVVLTAR